jgi:hypothetical protein
MENNTFKREAPPQKLFCDLFYHKIVDIIKQKGIINEA